MTVHSKVQLHPGMSMIQVWGWSCLRCFHQWMPRDKSRAPKVCPKCKSPYWNRPRKTA